MSILLSQLNAENDTFETLFLIETAQLVYRNHDLASSTPESIYILQIATLVGIVLILLLFYWAPFKGELTIEAAINNHLAEVQHGDTTLKIDIVTASRVLLIQFKVGSGEVRETSTEKKRRLAKEKIYTHYGKVLIVAKSTYTLRSIIYYEGDPKDIDGGHFFTEVLTEDSCIRYNDSEVGKVDQEIIFSDRRDVEIFPYILLYNRQ